MKILPELHIFPARMNSSRSSHEIYGLPHVLVDGFKHRMPAVEYHDRCYFLTHYHSDYYGGLSRIWNHGLIYCTSTTANLICNVLHVDAKTVRRVVVGDTVSIKGARVTFMDANHCPGAAILLFQLDTGLTHLHTGDLRYCPAMKLYPALQNVKIDRLYLDTTYAHPKHTFMAQDESIHRIVTLATQFLTENPEDGIIFMSAYNLGKERVIFALNDALQVPVFMDADKIRIISQIDGGLERVQSGQFTSNPHGAKIHICSMGFLGSLFPYFKPNFENIRQHMDDLNKCVPEAGIMEHFLHSKNNQMPLILPMASEENTLPSCTAVATSKITKSIAFIPTGWSDMGNFNKQHSIMTEDNVTVCIVPYSEHSNYNELIEFVTFLKPREVIPTVFSDEKNRLFILDLFRNCVDRVSNMRNFIARIASPAGNQEGSTSAAAAGGGEACKATGVVKNDICSSSSSSSKGGCNGDSGAGADQTGNAVCNIMRTSSSKASQAVHIDLCSDDEQEGGMIANTSKHTSTVFSYGTTSSGSSMKRTLDASYLSTAEASEGYCDVDMVNGIGSTSTASNIGLKKSCRQLGTTTSTSVVDVVSHTGSVKMWTCTMCTYCHKEPGSELFLQCSLCGSPRCMNN